MAYLEKLVEEMQKALRDWSASIPLAIAHKENKPGLVFQNTRWTIQSAVALGLLEWGRGNGTLAHECFAICLDAHAARVAHFARVKDIAVEQEAFFWDMNTCDYFGGVCGYLLDRPITRVPPRFTNRHMEGIGYAPWFRKLIADSCVLGSPIDHTRYHAARAKPPGHKLPKTYSEVWSFYIDVLDGAWIGHPTERSLAEHARVFALLKRIKDSDLVHSEGHYNDLVPDLLFAAVLKRIGFHGAYRHAWPRRER